MRAETLLYNMALAAFTKEAEGPLMVGGRAAGDVLRRGMENAQMAQAAAAPPPSTPAPSFLGKAMRLGFNAAPAVGAAGAFAGAMSGDNPTAQYGPRAAAFGKQPGSYDPGGGPGSVFGDTARGFVAGTPAGLAYNPWK